MLFENYKSEIIPKLQKKLGIKNPWALPRVVKLVISMRVPEGKENKQTVAEAVEELKVITGQQPKICRARQAVSGFKLKKGDPIGLKVTLRGKRRDDFLEKLFLLVLPRLRDFKGVSPSQFDQGGNFNIGLREQTVFPEIDIDKVKKQRGLQVTIVTKSRNQREARILLETLGLAFKKEK